MRNSKKTKEKRRRGGRAKRCDGWVGLVPVITMREMQTSLAGPLQAPPPPPVLGSPPPPPPLPMNDGALLKFNTVEDVGEVSISFAGGADPVANAIFSPSGTPSYIANKNNNSLFQLNSKATKVKHTLQIPNVPSSFDSVPDPKGKWIAVGSAQAGILSIFELRSSFSSSSSTVKKKQKHNQEKEKKKEGNLGRLITQITIGGGGPGVGLGSLAVTPDGVLLFASAYFLGVSFFIDTRTWQVVGSATVALGLGATAPMTDGRIAYMAATYPFPPASYAVSIFSVVTSYPTAAPLVTRIGEIDLPAGSGSYGCVVTPDNQWLCVANQFASNVAVIRTRENRVIRYVQIQSPMPYWLASTPDSQKIYVLSLRHTQQQQGENGVSVFYLVGDNSIRNRANSTRITMTSGQQPQDIGITPDPSPIASFTACPRSQCGRKEDWVFDASSSWSPIGEIAYHTCGILGMRHAL